MYSLLFLAFASFAVSLVLTPACRELCRRLGMVDRPDQGRKLHRQAVPRVGGIPIVLSCAVAFAILLISPLRAGALVQQSLPLVWNLIPAIAVVFLTGLVDDFWGLRPWQKLCGQLAAALMAYLAGVKILGVAGYIMPGWCSLPLTVIWFLVCTNSFNLIDGMDGLAAGVGLFASVTTVVAALLHDNVMLALATAPLAGSLLAFLRYNFNPASIFLGDSGSLTIGFLLGCYGVIWSQKSATLLGMTAPLIALAIPILDVLLSISRRLLRGQPIFEADRGHIHHRLLDRGLTPRRAALLLYGVCGVLAMLSLLQSLFANRYSGLILVLFCLVAWIGVQNLGYVEFRIARRMILDRAFQNMLNGEIALRRFEESLESASDLEACWFVLQKAGRDFGFLQVRLYVQGESYEGIAPAANSPESWTLNIPLSESDWVALNKDPDASHSPHGAASFADAIQRGFRRKLREFDLLAVRELSQTAVSGSLR